MPFTNEDQELAAQNVIDWLTDFFQWETYNEQEIDELGMLHGFTWEGHRDPIWTEGEMTEYLKERFTPRNPITQMLVGEQSSGGSCPIANTIRRGFPNSNRMYIEVSAETISIEDLEEGETVNIPCQDTPVAFFVYAFDSGHLPMYQHREEYTEE